MTLRLLFRAVFAFVVVVASGPVVTPTSPVAFVSGAAAPRNPEGVALHRPAAQLSSVALLRAAETARNPEGLALLIGVGRASQPTPADRAASFALEAVGVPYHWGGESPASGFDCSGLVRWAYKRVGLELPHNSYELYGVGREVQKSRLEPGDVLFFEGLGHVGLYLGGGRMVHAPYSGRRVEVIPLATTNYGERLIGARRIAAS